MRQRHHSRCFDSINHEQTQKQTQKPTKNGLINISQGVHAYLKQHDVPHIWNVDDEGHTPKTWASNLYQFAQRIFR